MSFSVFNFNIMHGRNRKHAVVPPSVSRPEATSNLRTIAKLIQRHDPDILTLQEVDEFSVLSGSFNQLEFLNKLLGYPYTYFAPSCSIGVFGKRLFVSGSAILSRFPLENCRSYNFHFSFPTERKGFVIADAILPQGGAVTVASIHLVWVDWTRRDPRGRQLRKIQTMLGEKRDRLVLAGDFNCEYTGREASLRNFVNDINLNTYERGSMSMHTHKSWVPKRRLDWILTSNDIRFISYETVPDIISDHLAVYAKLEV